MIEMPFVQNKVSNGPRTKESLQANYSYIDNVKRQTSIFYNTDNLKSSFTNLSFQVNTFLIKN